MLAAGTIAAEGRGLGTLSTYIPAYLRSGLHLSTLTVGAPFTQIMAASIAGPVAGLLADRFGRARTLTVTYVTAAIAVAAFGYGGRSLWVLAGARRLRRRARLRRVAAAASSPPKSVAEDPA